MTFIPSLRIVAVVVMLVGLTGCVSVPMPAVDAPRDTNAVALLERSATAHGWDALQRHQSLDVRFEGTWDWFTPRVQPVLCDTGYRGTSEERYAIQPTQSVTQSHFGAKGTKDVTRDANGVRVSYNGQPTQDKDTLDAAALVADAYRLFLLGPAFIRERQAVVRMLKPGRIDGFDCDHLLAVLRPGLGNSAEDRVILSIDKKTHLVRRVRITLEGLRSTRGAIADITPRDYIRIEGVMLPTSYHEQVKRPLDAPIHDWRLTAVEFDPTNKEGDLK